MEDVNTGLKYVNNDACYPSLIVIGQLMNALLSGKYDPHKIALVISQTGGGCRATNYISFIRRALEKGWLRLCSCCWFKCPGNREKPVDLALHLVY